MTQLREGGETLLEEAIVDQVQKGETDHPVSKASRR